MGNISTKDQEEKYIKTLEFRYKTCIMVVQHHV